MLRVSADFESTAFAADNRALIVVRQPLRSDDHDRYRRRRGILTETFEQVEAGHVGEPQIEQDDVGRSLVRLREPVDTRCRFDQLVLVAVQQLPDDEPRRLLVVDRQHTDRFACVDQAIERLRRRLGARRSASRQ